MVTRVPFRLIVLFAVLAITGCSEPKIDSATVLICEIHEVNSKLCGAAGCIFNPGFRLTVTFLKEDRTQIALGDVLGAQRILDRVENSLISGDSLDRNVVQFDRNSSFSGRTQLDTLMLNTVSGQMYFYSLLDGTPIQENYAHCDPALPNAR